MSSHSDINKNSRFYSPYRSSIFILSDISNNDGEQTFDIDVYERIFIVSPRGDVADDSWIIICILPLTKHMHYICTHDLQLSSDEWNLISTNVIEKFHLSVDDYTQTGRIPYPHSYFQVCENKFDGGIYVLALLLCIVNESPISFKPSDASNLRAKVAFWIINEYMPDLRS